ncbi:MULTISPECIES: TonB-dependent receptor [unclassified Sphingobium]|uniref:TonB-dependent receptor n=1 Tax=unclassified Sphingobium TaxID=2611147 RepID=UPI001F1E0F8F|nr:MULTISPECIES: TonB-dependent receptor [unclassified Sphingobium]
MIKKLRFGSIDARASPIDALCRRRSSALGALPSPLSSAPAAVSGASPADRSDSQAGQLNALTIQVPANASPALGSNRIADWDPGVDFRNDDRFFQIALRGDLDVTDHITLTSISAYEDYRQDAVRDIDGTALQILLLGTQGRIKSFSQELRLVGDSGPLKWIVGANYAKDKANEFQSFDIRNQTNNPIFGIPNVGADLTSTQNSKTLAAFGNAEFEITPDLTLQAGARYTENRRWFNTCSLDNGNGNIAAIIGVVQSVAKGAFGLPAGPVPQVGGCFNLDANYDPGEFRSRLNENNVSWRVGAKYKITSDALIYANVSRGYKSGLFPTVLASSNNQFAPVKQEKLTAYEAGVKASFLDRTVDLTAAVFYYDYRNKQVRSHFIDPIFVVLESVANAPKSDAIGAEAQVVVRPLRGLTLNLSGSYTDSKIKDFIGVNQFGAVEDFSGTRMPFTPEWQGVGDAEYRWSLGPSHEVFVGGSLSYTGASNAFLGADSVGKMVARTLVDLRAGVSGPGDRWKVYVWGRNVTNEKYQNYVMRITDTVIGYSGKPATYGVTLAVNFR